MLLTREELRYDAGNARFDLERDRDLLAWIFSQALYGEATGCYCGATLYTAPDIDAATFLSRQAVEEFAHFRNFLKIFRILGTRPSPPNRVIKFLSSHERLWDHHVALEMAIGEGLVLVAFYALEDVVPHPEVKVLLASIGRQEEGHVDFGERRTLDVLRETPRRRRQLLGRCLLSVVALRFLARHLEKRLPPGHPVLSQLPRFLDHVLRTTEVRMQRLGLLSGTIADIGFFRRWALIGNGLFWALARGLFARRRPRIPEGYLRDPVVERVLAGRPELVEA